jgi:hypothetical protein
MRTALAICALLFAASASAQEHAPRVWTDADLAKPLPKLHPAPAEPEVLAAMKRRADYIPFGAGGFAIHGGGGFQAAPPAAPSVEGLYARELALQRATAPHELLYASQPLYPFVSVIYSNRPYGGGPRRPAPCPVPQSLRGRR